MRYPSTTKLTLTFIFVCLLLRTALGQSVTLDFDDLPLANVGADGGFVNGAPGSPGDFWTIGTGDNFGQPETLQLWGLQELQFFNAYTPAYGSWRGFSWSNVQNVNIGSYTNQYAAFPGGDNSSNGDGVYAVAFENGTYFNLPTGAEIESVDLALTTWTALIIRDGDQENMFARKFAEGDLYSVILTGFSSENMGGDELNAVQVDLADFRNGQTFIQDTWETLDLSLLAGASSIALTFETTDVGLFGGNTPAYVALDNLTFNVSAMPEPSGCLFSVGLGLFLIGRRRRRRL